MPTLPRARQGHGLERNSGSPRTTWYGRHLARLGHGVAAPRPARALASADSRRERTTGGYCSYGDCIHCSNGPTRLPAVARLHCDLTHHPRHREGVEALEGCWGREGGRERRARPRRQRPVPPGTGLMGRGSFTKKNGREAGQQALLALMTQGTLSARLARRCGQADVPPDRGPRSTRPGPGPRPTLVPQVRNSSLLQLPRPRLRRARIPAGVCARVETPATTMREAPHWPIW